MAIKTFAEPQPGVPPESPKVGELFPLSFTPFEYYYLLDDRPDYPSVFPICLECRGPLDRASFERAYQMAHERHPLLSARIEVDRRGWPYWTAGKPAPIEWGETVDATPDGKMPRVGVRLRVIRDGDHTTLSFVFHHVAVDGMGAFCFITDLMVAYAHLYSGSGGAPPWGRLDRTLLAARDGHRLCCRKAKLRELVRVAGLSLRLLTRRAAMVSDRGHRGNDDAGARACPEFLVHTLSEEETDRLSHVARQLSVRVNELLVRDCLLMLEGWNRGTSESRRPIRLLLPANLRRKGDYRMPAANVFSYIFLTRRAVDCQDRSQLLASVRRELEAAKRGKWALYFEAGLRWFCFWPRLLRWSLNRPDWAFATANFSNLGSGFSHVPLPWRDGRRLAGELIVENGYGASLIRAGTRLALAVHTYAGRMSICVRCDPATFGAAEQRELLEAYLRQLQVTMDLEN